jgi:ATP-dependent Lon protease
MAIEVTLMPGKGGLMLTGQLGEVMQESAQAALSYARTNAKQLGLRSDFEKMDIHIHVPEGAIPKDGPSAGITMATALVSALSQRAVFKDVGFTGEITLRGRVLPIGGLREKVLAAHRAGLKTLVIPKKNKKDLIDLPRRVQRNLHLVLVDTRINAGARRFCLTVDSMAFALLEFFIEYLPTSTTASSAAAPEVQSV